MHGESSILPVTTVKGSSENYGVKSKTRTNEPLLHDNQPATIDVNVNENKAIAVAEAPSRILPDINLYQNKKTVGTGLMDIALLVNNVNQLRHIIDSIDTSSPYFYISLSLVIASIILQVVVGILLAINCRYDVKDCVEICRADRINNWITVLIFLVTAVNVILPALGLPDKGF